MCNIRKKLEQRIVDLNNRKEELHEYLSKGSEWEASMVTMAEDTISEKDIPITLPEDMYNETIIDKAIELAKKEIDSMEFNL